MIHPKGYFPVFTFYFRGPARRCGICFWRGQLFFTLIGEKRQTCIAYMVKSVICGNVLLIARKELSLISLCVVLLVTYRWFLYLVFVFLLGAICSREALRYDFLIAEKVTPLCFHPLSLQQRSWCEGLWWRTPTWSFLLMETYTDQPQHQILLRILM